MKKRIALLLICILVLSLCGCDAGKGSSGSGTGKKPGESGSSGGESGAQTPSTPVSLMGDIKIDLTMSSEDVDKELAGPAVDYLAKFSAALVKACNSDDNLLLSPLSVLYALSMTTNGADGMTRCELLEALSEGKYTGEVTCGTSSTGVGDIWDEIQDNLNRYLKAYLNQMEYSKLRNYEEGKCGELHIANSIWFKDSDALKVEKDFLKTNGEYYNAGIMKAEFNEETRQSINKWIEDNTAGMIKDMLKELSPDAVMYLINALSFEGDWVSPFEDYQVQEGVFYGEDSETDGISFMYNQEDIFLEDEKVKGFIKYYYGWRYGFVALLPKDGVTVDEYIESMDGIALMNMIKNTQYKEVKYSIPKFSEENALSLVETFEKLGVVTPFDSENANFSKMATSANDNIYIGNIYHNTYIEVHETGTKAGAATIVEMTENAADFEDAPPEEVYLDHPFIYMIVDLQTGLPVFVGTVKNL